MKLEASFGRRSKESILRLKSRTTGPTNLADQVARATRSTRVGAIGQYILTVPLTFIPFIGWALLIFLNAAKTVISYVAPLYAERIVLGDRGIAIPGGG